jgi:hypothetical protein
MENVSSTALVRVDGTVIGCGFVAAVTAVRANHIALHQLYINDCQNPIKRDVNSLRSIKQVQIHMNSLCLLCSAACCKHHLLLSCGTLACSIII